MKKLYTCLLLLAHSLYGFAQNTSSFDNLPLGSNGYWNGTDNSGGFTNGDAYFTNVLQQGYWNNGFGYSNNTDNTTAGFMNQYSAYPGSGVGGSSQFAIGRNNSIIRLTNAAKTKEVTGFYVANTTYAALSMLQGDAFAKKFGDSTNAPDYFKLQITGYRNNVAISDTVTVNLADFTFTDNTKDYVLSTWRWVDLRKLGILDSLLFLLKSSDNGLFGMNTPGYFAMDHFNEPLYDKAVVNGSTQAIYKDSAIFKSWASTCTVTRGLQDFSKPNGGYASVGESMNGTLKAGVNSIVSLGDKGEAVLEFPVPIKNGAGPDFAVFENGFNVGLNQFLELAFVEVSSDGVNYVRFPSISKTNATSQLGGFAPMDASMIHNLAGKYVGNYGTPFDLEELKNNSLIDVTNITHVKIIDVIGTIDLLQSSKDSLGNPINDPYATPFASSGFDLDAVGVINQNDLSTSIVYSNKQTIQVYPNPSANQFNISLLDNSLIGENLYIYDITGSVITNQIITENMNVDASNWDNGIYYIRIGNTSQKIVKID